MEVFDQVKKWNLSVSLSDDQKRLKIHPWSTVTTSQKQWFVENKQAIIEKIKSVGEGVFHDSDIADGSFPKFWRNVRCSAMRCRNQSTNNLFRH